MNKEGIQSETRLDRWCDFDAFSFLGVDELFGVLSDRLVQLKHDGVLVDHVVKPGLSRGPAIKVQIDKPRGV